MKKVLYLFLVLVAIASCNSPQTTTKPEVDKTALLAKRVDSLMGEMTLKEKVNMIHASSAFTSGGVERLGIPEIIYSDGPHGVRREHGRDWEIDQNVYDSSTYLPVGISLASTWNPKLGYQFGKVLGSEARYRSKDVILGPGLNIIRSPLNGRNFEYMTEDPYLNSQFVVGYIKGVQENDVAACAKHYIANTLEFEREYVDVQMDDRALREIYLPGFKAAVQEGGVYTIMSAYNKFRGEYCSESQLLLDQILEDEFGFEGIVVSDWNAVKNPKLAANAGVDVEMGTDLMMLGRGLPLDYNKFHMADTLLKMVKAGEVAEEKVHAKVKSILTTMHKIGMFNKDRLNGEYNTKAHQKVAKKIADEAIILLKNEDNILPVNTNKTKKILVVGANAARKQAGGGGSSQVKAFYEVTPLEGLMKYVDDNLEIEYSKGYEVKRDGSVNTDLRNEAIAAANDADMVIYVGGWIHGYTDEWNDNAYDAEIIDKESMTMPFGQNELIEGLLAKNENTVVVMVGGGPVDMTAWQESTKGIIQAWYPGMEGGNALADIIFGKVNPSGKLPVTLPARLEDSPAHSIAQYPDENKIIDHKEGIFVGYRYFDTYEVAPAFAFGHGLSYTTFDYSNLIVDKTEDGTTISFDLTNSGEMDGAEVVQVYVGDVASTLERPSQELKAFEKVWLTKGETHTVKMNLGEDAFSYYDDQQGKWVVEPGKFTINIGSSSRDIKLTGELEL